ncbi:IF44L-like protein [Mya arenaria]|uniref:IF44L-like protein n=1 Tax=Mya arenaria TaxID=6604 RepID=A0ABY7GB58_MYAAR|nr:IF44L-like protein [Mya arenaria]
MENIQQREGKALQSCEENISASSYDMKGLGAEHINNGSMKCLELEVYKVEDVPVPQQWRKTSKWCKELEESLKSSVSSMRPASEMKVPDFRILLLGPVGSGKSSFCNTVTSVYRGRITQRAICGKAKHSITSMASPIHGKSDILLSLAICSTFQIKLHLVELDEGVNILALQALQQMLNYAEDFMENIQQREGKALQSCEENYMSELDVIEEEAGTL